MDANSNTAVVASASRDHTARGLHRRGDKKQGKLKDLPSGAGRRRFSITLSPKSAEAFDWLKKVTDADTDSEVIRNALRAHYVLLQKHIDGDIFYTSPADRADQLTKIDLFIAK